MVSPLATNTSCNDPADLLQEMDPAYLYRAVQSSQNCVSAAFVSMLSMVPAPAAGILSGWPLGYAPQTE